MNACPSCGRQLAEMAVFCVDCGYDLRTGKRRTVQIDRAPEYVDFAVNTWRCVVVILAGWAVCLFVSGCVWLLGEGQFGERQTVAIFTAGAVLALAWSLVAFRRRTRVVVRHNEAGHPVVELHRLFGLLRVDRRIELSGSDTVYLLQIPHSDRSSLANIALGLVKLSILTPFLLGHDYRRGILYRVECRADRIPAAIPPVVVMQSDETWNLEMSATARLISEVLKMPLKQELGLFN